MKKISSSLITAGLLFGVTNLSADMFFTATYEKDKVGIFRSDGTADGTVRVEEAVADGTNYPSGLIVFKEKLYYSLRDSSFETNLYSFDGSTLEKIEVYPDGNDQVMADYMGKTSTHLFFAATNSTGRGVFAYDGENPPVRILDNGTNFTYHASIGNEIYFGTKMPGDANPNLFRSDGTRAGTVAIKEYYDIGSMGVAGDKILFNGNPDRTHHQLHISDGTTGGTNLLKTINPTDGATIQYMVSDGDKAIFSANDGTTWELWESDGTADGTKKYTDGTVNNIALFVYNEGTAYFANHSVETGIELWSFNKTDGAVKLSDFSYNGDASEGIDIEFDQFDVHFDNGKLYFPARAKTTIDGVENLSDKELWIYDGTNPPYLLKDIFPGSYQTEDWMMGTVTNVNSSNPYNFASFSPMTVFNVKENFSALGAVKVGGLNGNSITYSLSGTDSALFNIDATTGVVSFKAAPDFETPLDANSDNTYEFIVTGVDSDSTEKTEEVEVVVQNLNNELPPTFSLENNITNEDILFRVDLSQYANDPEGNASLQYTASVDDNSLAYASTLNSTLVVTPYPNQNGIVNVEINVTDGDYTVSDTLQLTITSVQDTPLFSGLSATFLNENNVASTSSEANVFSIDFDADGDIDILSSSTGDDKVAWHENDGSGSFTEHIVSSTASQARSVFAIDVDSDGDIDVLSASSGDNRISWYENDGSHNFTEHNISTSASHAMNVFAIDVDSDGDIDVLSASSSDNKIAWYENDGSENFTEHEITTSRNFARSVFAIDMDDDGDVDVLAASQNDDTVAWYRNDGSENFTELVIASDADYTMSVHAVDLDGDGDKDVLSASFLDDKIAWYENDGSENFTAHIVTSLADGASDVNVADIDGDGDNDILSTSYAGNKVTWYENDGSQNFTLNNLPALMTNSANSVLAADVNGDDKLDIIWGSQGTGRVQWMEQGTLPFSADVNENEITVATFAASDADGDTLTYAISGTDSSLFNLDTATGAVTFKSAPDFENPLDADGNNVYELNITVTDTANNTNSEAIEITVVNLLNELKPVFVLENNTTAEDTIFTIDLSAYASDPEGNTSLIYSASVDDSSLASVSINGSVLTVTPAENQNGVVNIEINASDSRYTTTENISFTISSVADAPSFGKLEFMRESNISTTANAPYMVYAVDMDKDSDMDIVAAGNSGDAVSWYENDGSNNFTEHNISTSASGVEAIFAIDLNGDGEMDVLSASATDNKIAWYENDGSESFTEHNISEASNSAKSVFAIDINGDNAIDVLSASSADNKISWYENDGSNNFTEHNISTSANGAKKVFAIDMDGDSDIDVLSASSTDNRVVWYENDGSESFTEHDISTLVLSAEDVFAVDVDGDSDIDVLSISSSQNRVVLFENDGNENFSEFNVTTTASSAKGVYASDLDGDGDVDIISASSGDNRVVWYENRGSKTFVEHELSTASNGALSVFATDVDSDGDADVVSASSGDNKLTWYEFDLAPVLVTLVENQTVAATVTATDGDGDALTYSISGTDSSLFSINSSTGVISYVNAPDFELATDSNQDNVYELNVTATDPSNASAWVPVKVTVVNTDNELAPTFSLENNSTDEDVGFTIDLSSYASDPEGNTSLVYSVDVSDNSLATASINGSVLSVTPATNQNGVVTVSVTVTDGLYNVTEDMSFTINSIADAPIIGDSSVALDINGTQVKLTAKDASSNDNFGHSVSVQNGYAVVSATGNSGGSIYLFDLSAVDVNASQIKLTSNDLANTDSFGSSIAISDNYILVGASGDADGGASSGSAYLFDLSASDVNASQEKLTALDANTDDLFGSAVAIGNNFAIVGATGDDDNESGSGSAYLFDLRSSNINASQQKLTAKNPVVDASFGNSVSITDTYAIVGAYKDNAGANESGSAYLFDLSASDINASQEQLTAKDLEANDRFAHSVIISDSFIAIGANQEDSNGVNSGSVYLFNLGVSDINASQEKLTTKDASENDAFGNAVALSTNHLVVGASASDSEAGSAYLFNLSSSDINASQVKLSQKDAALQDYFGNSVSVTDSHIVVGSFNDDDGGSESGSVSLFSFNPSLNVTAKENRVEVATIPASDGDGDSLTYSISGADSSLFTINSATGALTFKTAPNYENPRDSNQDNIYVVNVNVTDGSISVSKAVVITIENATESFAVVNGANTSSVIESNVIYFEEISNGTSIGIIGGEYQINGDGNWRDTNTTVDLNDSVQMRLTTSASFSTESVATLLFADQNITFSVTTKADTTSTPTPRPRPVNAVCGSAEDSSYATLPIGNLCSVGNPGNVLEDGNNYVWICGGSNGGTNASCSAEKEQVVVTPPDETNTTEPVDPSDPNEPTDPVDPNEPSEPTDPTDPTNPTEPVDPNEPTEPTNPTDPVEPTEPTVPDNNTTTPTEPEEPTVVNGMCGVSQGAFFRVSPTENLCSRGENSGVSLDGNQFNWSCSGANGGELATCFARRVVSAINDNGNFDEDPTDSDIDVIIITEDGAESKETINTIDTGKEVVINESNDNNSSEKKFVLELKDTNSSSVENREIVIDNPNATSTTTDNGFEITADSDDENRSVASKIEVNTNGTSISSLITTDKVTGETKRAAISSFKTDVNTSVDSDGSIKIVADHTEATVNSDGSTEHKVKLDSGKETVATSKADNTISSILEDGTVQTKATVINDSNEEVVVSVNGKSDGKAVHVLKVTDTDGNEVITRAESEIIGAVTTIEEDGTVETSVTTEDNIEFKVQANSDGSATHVVSLPQEDGSVITSSATSKISGASTTVLENGSVETKASTRNADNEEVTVSVNGMSDGKAVHTLKVTDSSGNEVETRAESEIAGAVTTIEEDGSVETTVTTENSVEMKVQASSDGVAIHTVSFTNSEGDAVTSRATSKVPGASTTVTTNGEVVTEAKVTQTDANGDAFEIKAIAETSEDGTTKTRFERVNLNTGERILLDNTVSSDTPFEEGNEVEVEQLDVGLQIKVQANVTQSLVIE